MDIFWKLRDFFSAHWRAYAAAAVLLSIVAVLNLLPPAIVGWVVDGIVAGSLRRRELILYVTAIVGCALAVYICRYQWRRILYGASYRLSLELRHRIYRHLLQLSPEDLRAFSTGDLMARATNDVQAVEMCAGEAVLSIFDGLLTGVLVLAVMVFTLSGWLTLMALAPWPLMSWAMWRLGTLLHRRFDVAQSTFSAFNSVTEESIAGIRALRGLSAEPHALRIFAQASDTANEASLDVARIDARYEPIIYLTVGASFLISVSAGAWLIEHGQLSVGELTSFTIYLGHLVWPMFAFGWMANLVQRGKAGWNRVQDFLQARPVIADDGEETETGDNALDVAITRFNYRGRDEPVLQDLRFRLLAGETLGVVGPTGSGKSTLLNLIARFYESQGVQIRLGQKPLAAYRLDALRSAFNYVVQEGLLFSASIRENLLLACPDADESRLLAALGTAALDRDLAGFADGMETLIGERGISLSGGQRQRLCLARALLTDAPILLLDDPLSAVDVETEKLVLAALRRHAPEQARVIVSHRLSAVREADEILVLREGRIAERGNHHTLLALDGWYARTWRYQQLVADRVEAR